MSVSLLEELEKLLSETNHERQRLNFFCETVFDLLNPPGTEKNGLFKIEKKEMTTQLVEASEDNIDISSSLGESLESVTKLIAFGKHVRDTNELEKKKNINSVSDICNKSFPSKDKRKSATQVASNKKTSYSLGVHKEVNIDKNVKQNVARKTDLHSGRKSTSLQTNSFSRPEKIKHEVASDFTSNNTNVPEGSLMNECNRVIPKTYSHSCSLSLSNFVKTLKMPEDLRCGLKHYYYYEKHKENLTFWEKSPKPTSQTFRERLHNVVSFKL